MAFAPPAAAGAADGDGRLRAAPDLAAELRADGWKLLAVAAREQAEFVPHGQNGIGLSADNAVGFLYQPVANDMGAKRTLSWRWRVDEAVVPTDLSRIGTDDRSLAVHLVFPRDTETLPLWERIEHAVTRLVAPPLAGRVLTYVWGGIHEPGATLANPHLDGQGTLIVLRRGTEKTGQWFMENIDFVADFRRAFGYSPPPPMYLAISSDSDDTAGRSRGLIADLVFG